MTGPRSDPPSSPGALRAGSPSWVECSVTSPVCPSSSWTITCSGSTTSATSSRWRSMTMRRRTPRRGPWRPPRPGRRWRAGWGARRGWRWREIWCVWPGTCAGLREPGNTTRTTSSTLSGALSSPSLTSTSSSSQRTSNTTTTTAPCSISPRG